MNINTLSKSLPKDENGHIKHPSLTYPATATTAPPCEKHTTNTTTPPPWPHYTTAQAASILHVPMNQIWRLLSRKKITGVNHQNTNLWKKDEIDTYAATLMPITEKIPQGYINLNTASKLSGTSQKTILRAIDKYAIPNKIIKTPTEKGLRKIKILSRSHLIKHLPKIQSRTQKHILTNPNNSTKSQ